MKNPLIDRTTAQEYLTMFTHRGVFSNIGKLPNKEDILKNEMTQLGVTKLSTKQERTLLRGVGSYTSKGRIVKDFGDYVFMFNRKLYIEELEKAERELKDEFLKDEYTEEEIKIALAKIGTYKLAHKMVLIILAEVYQQRKFEDLEIPREKIIHLLGFSSSDKHIYSQIKDALFSLRWLDYAVYKFNTSKSFSKEGKITGNFIYNIEETRSSYKLGINKKFVGSVAAMFDDNKKTDFVRGYWKYPIKYISESKTYNDSTYYLGHYLIMEMGNPKLRQTKKKRIIAQSVTKLQQEGIINHSRCNVRVNNFLDALEELPFIEKIEPSIKEMRSMKSSTVEKLTLHIYLPDDNDKLSEVLFAMQKHPK